MLTSALAQCAPRLACHFCPLKQGLQDFCSLGERGFVDDEREGEHAARQQTSCREVADVMGAALQQGASGHAIELFRPDRLLQVEAVIKPPELLPLLQRGLKCPD